MLDKSDKLIVIAQDESKIEIRDAAAVDENVFEREPNRQEEPHTLLVLGYTDMLKQILIEDDAYAAPGSKVICAAESGKIDLDALPSKDELKNIEVCVRECRIYKRHVLEKLLAEKPSSIMLMSDPELDDEEADARTLMLQLQLTDIAEEIGVDIPLTIEMNSTRNQRLSQMMRATDFVVSSSITAKMMAQIAEQRHKKAIINDLLSEGGSSIYMKPITRYVTTGKPVDFYTLGASAARYGEIAIGYKKVAEDGSFAIEVNPYSREAEKFSDKDDLIVVAKN